MSLDTVLQVTIHHDLYVRVKALFKELPDRLLQTDVVSDETDVLLTRCRASAWADWVCALYLYDARFSHTSCKRSVFVPKVEAHILHPKIEQPAKFEAVTLESSLPVESELALAVLLHCQLAMMTTSATSACEALSEQVLARIEYHLIDTTSLWGWVGCCCSFIWDMSILAIIVIVRRPTIRMSCIL